MQEISKPLYQDQFQIKRYNIPFIKYLIIQILSLWQWNKKRN